MAASVLALVLIAGLALVSWHTYQQVEADLSQELQTEADRVATHADRTLEAAELAMEMLATRFSTMPWDALHASFEVGRTLNATADRLPQISHLWLIDQNALLQRVSGTPAAPRIDLFDRPYWRVHGIGQLGHAYISRRLQDRLEAREINVLSLPFTAGEHEFRGVIAAALTPRYYEPLITPAMDCAGCEIAIVRADGTVLVATDGVAIPDTPAPELTFEIDRIAAAVTPDPILATLPDTRSNEVLSAKAGSSRYDYAVVTMAPRDLILERSFSLLGLALLLGLTALALIATGAWLLSRTAARQEQDAEALRSTAERLASAKADAELKQQAVAEASRAKSDFLAMMSHELRTPLNAILGFSEVIASRAFGPNASERYADYARDIHASGEHLLSLINDILDLSKIEAGRVDLRPEPLDIEALLASTVKLVRQRGDCGRVPIRISAEIETVLLDRRAIKQVALNLLSNAAKFTDRGEIVVRATHEANHFVLSVADTGPGMDAEQVRRAREPFCQVDMSLSRRHEGTGLGLPIVERLVSLLGGSVEIDSAPGRGTTVRVRLPAPVVCTAPTPAVQQVA